MDWHLQKLDGTWIEASKLPKDSSDFQCAILMEGKQEHLRLNPTTDAESDRETWFVVEP